MRLKKTAQSAFEYLVVITIMTSFIIPIALIYYKNTANVNDDLAQALTEKLAHDLLTAAEEVYYSAGAARRSIDANVPQNIVSMTSENNNTLVFTMNDDTSYVYVSDVQINVTVDPDDIVGGRFVIQKTLSSNIIRICSPSYCD